MDNSTNTVKIYRNQRPGEGVQISFVRRQTNLTQFIKMCSEVFKMDAKRVFDVQGEEILQLDQLHPNKEYYISAGEPFAVPQTTEGRQSVHQSLIQDKQNQNAQQYPIVVMGAAAVGKSNVTLRYVKNETYDYYDPTLMDEYKKNATIDDKPCVVRITDTCGSETYHSLRTQWMRDKEGLIFIYAINSTESFQDLQDLLELFSSMDKSTTKPAVVVIVGNKADLAHERLVSEQEGANLAQRYDALFFETSAKTAYNIEKVFVSLIRRISKEREQIAVRSKTRLQQGSNQDDDKSWKLGRCCLV